MGSISNDHDPAKIKLGERPISNIIQSPLPKTSVFTRACNVAPMLAYLVHPFLRHLQ